MDMEDREQQEENQLPSVMLDAMVSAEIDKQIATANAWPRSISTFKKTALEMATLDEETAESCFYALPRSGKNIEGPSARLAEIVACAWKHMRVEARQVGTVTREDKFVTVRGTAWDLQSNVAWSVETKRRIVDKFGKQYSEDMIVMTINAAAAIASRNVVFKVVPSAYWRPIYLKCRDITKGDIQTLADRRAQALEHFQKLGAPKDRVLATLGVADIEDITLDHLVTLKGVATAIREEATTIDEAFPKPEPKEPPKRVSADKPGGGGGVPPAKDGVDDKQPGADAAPPDGGKGKGKADRAKPDETAERLAALAQFVEGPLEAIRDASHQDFLNLCKGLKGPQFEALLMKYNERKKEL